MKHPYRIIGLLLVAAIAAAFVLSPRSDYWQAEAARLRATVDDVQHALDTTKARHAEREVGWLHANDSLSKLLADIRTRGMQGPQVVERILHDTAFAVEYVRTVDTVLAQCERCAKRVDSLVSQARVERTLSDSTITALNVWGAAGWRVAAKNDRGPRVAAYLDGARDVARGDFVLGADVQLRVLGDGFAFVRGEQRVGLESRQELRVGARVRAWP